MVNMTSRYIPVETKRIVRSRCGFGCVICGLPVFHYDHIEEFSRVDEHKPENLTCLCPNHHQEKTSKRLPVDAVRRFNETPYNLSKATTAPHLFYFFGGEFYIQMGGMRATSDFCHWGGIFDALHLAGERVLGFRKEENSILLTLKMVDAKGGIILMIEDNELVLSTSLPDISIVGQRLVIKCEEEKLPTIILKNDNGINVVSGIFRANGKSAIIEGDKITFMPRGAAVGGIGGHNNMIFIEA